MKNKVLIYIGAALALLLLVNISLIIRAQNTLKSCSYFQQVGVIKEKAYVLVACTRETAARIPDEKVGKN